MYSICGQMTFDKDAKTTQWKRTVSSTIGVRKTVYQLAKEWRWTLPYSIRYTGEKLHDIGFGNDSFDVSPKAQKTNKKYTNEATSKFKVPCIQGHS